MSAAGRVRRIAVLPGDGVGAEVVAGPVELLEAIAEAGRIEVTGPWPVGASAFGELGTGLPADTLAACDGSDAMFFGAAGEHPGVSLDDYRPEHSIIGLRQRYDLRVSIRTIVRPGESRGRPLIVLRNLLGGAYGAASTRTESDGSDAAGDEVILTPDQIAELAGMACDLVEQGLASSIVSADKANLMATSRLWRSITGQVAGARGVPLRHTYVDRMAFELAHDDVTADTVVLTEGIFGDMLSDLAAREGGLHSAVRLGQRKPRRAGPRTLRRPVRAGARLRAPPHRQGEGQPFGRLPGPGRAAGVVPGDGRAGTAGDRVPLRGSASRSAHLRPGRPRAPIRPAPTPSRRPSTPEPSPASRNCCEPCAPTSPRSRHERGTAFHRGADRGAV